MNIWEITLKAMQDIPAKEYGDIVRMQYDIPRNTCTKGGKQYKYGRRYRYVQY